MSASLPCGKSGRQRCSPRALQARCVIIKVVNGPLPRTSEEIADIQMARQPPGYQLHLAARHRPGRWGQSIQAASDVVDRRMRESSGTRAPRIAGIRHVPVPPLYRC